jgi:hypothetical protein
METLINEIPNVISAVGVLFAFGGLFGVFPRRKAWPAAAGANAVLFALDLQDGMYRDAVGYLLIVFIWLLLWRQELGSTKAGA